MRHSILGTLFLIVSLFSHTSSATEQFDWQIFDELLKTQVHTTDVHGVSINAVSYLALNDSESFHSIADQLASYNPTDLSRSETLAFYINAYNYFALKIVVDNTPENSIKDIGNFFSPVWKKTAGAINGQDISLDTIEHKILRLMGEPRIHFAIVCASVSCPDLRKEVYKADYLDSQLDEQVRLFLANAQKGARVEEDDLLLSKIFSWFEEDFSEAGGVLAFVESYNDEFKGFGEFETLDYDWRLNTTD